MIVFDATRFHGKPDLRGMYGIHPCVTQTWVPPGKTHEGMPLEWAKLASDTGAILCHDYEAGLDPNKLDGPEVESFFDSIARVVDAVHEEYPHVRQGNFGLPWRADREAYSYDDVTGEKHWKGLADRLDFAAPESYLDPTMSLETWVNRTAEHVAEARKLNKRVYLWFGVTYDTHTNWDYVPREHLLHVRNWCEGQVDGLLLWGGHFTNPQGRYAERPFDHADAWVDVFRRR